MRDGYTAHTPTPTQIPNRKKEQYQEEEKKHGGKKTKNDDEERTMHQNML